MKRLIDETLLKWKNDINRKPLLIYGARQVGKTYSIANFGEKYYDNYIYLNFEGNNNLQQVFDTDLNPNRIIGSLETIYNQKIFKEKTLLIFDEIQECERALTSLKYFQEECPKYHIIAAGSLLGLAINRGEYSFPVGKVNIITMYPLTFEEFLMSLKRYDLIDLIKKSYFTNTPIENIIHERILEYYYEYLIIGGMPSVVNFYLKKQDYNYIKIIQSNILAGFYKDMTRYNNIKDSNKLKNVYTSISKLITDDKNLKFINSRTKSNSYENSIYWLEKSRMIYKCNKVKEGLIPLKIYEDLLSYKIYMSDIGLLSNNLNLNTGYILSDMLSSNTKGAIAENYVMQQLVSIGLEPFYWESQGKAEVDFIFQTKNGIVPIECKYSHNVQSKSLQVFIDKYNPIYSIRVSTKNFGFENNIKSIPLYALFCLKDINK